MHESLATNFSHQLKHSTMVREFAYKILQGEHQGEFERKDYIAFALFNRCLQTHEAMEIIVKNSLLDDAWVLARALVEHVVNCAYMLQVADAQIADDFADYPNYKRYSELKDLRTVDEGLLRQIVSTEKEEEIREAFDAVRARFDGKTGDKWSPDDRLYKRAARVDAKIGDAMDERHTEFLWLVNSAWRYGSGYVHGTADALAGQVSEIENGVRIHRKYTKEEAAQALYTGNFAIYLVLLLLDLRLGGRNAAEIKIRFSEWGASDIDEVDTEVGS